ncbi:hypothetical protein [Subtercola boreus]|nr:hypothetical protein [Subtercola boreus]
MDVERAVRKLEIYLALSRQVNGAVVPGEYWNNRAEALNNQAELMLSTVQ